MSPWLYVVLVTVAFLGVSLQFACFCGEMMRVGSGCLCRKGVVNFDCPIHGRRS